MHTWGGARGIAHNPPHAPTSGPLATGTYNAIACSSFCCTTQCNTAHTCMASKNHSMEGNSKSVQAQARRAPTPYLVQAGPDLSLPRQQPLHRMELVLNNLKRWGVWGARDTPPPDMSTALDLDYITERVLGALTGTGAGWEREERWLRKHVP
jgi:hypothetical protein